MLINACLFANICTLIMKLRKQARTCWAEGGGCAWWRPDAEAAAAARIPAAAAAKGNGGGGGGCPFTDTGGTAMPENGEVLILRIRCQCLVFEIAHFKIV